MARSTKAGSARPAGLPVLRLLAVSVVALTTANCAQNAQKLASAPSSGSSYDPKYGVKASPRLYNEGDTIPKGGGRRFSGRPYVVAGRTYVPRDDARGYVREGLASWYGSAFHGRMTANGEVFDRHSIAAAHPTLPLPSYVRVTNLTNRHSMIVRVNDRGPYHANRLMDVSEEVAQALEFHRSGTAKVRVEYVGKASTAGSDDRKLMATLRTDGAPAHVGSRSPVMMADLGPDVAQERLESAPRPVLAFKPAPDEEAAPRPVRPAPVLVAGGSSVAVPAALQPTAPRSHGFQPSLPVRAASPTQMAQAAPKAELKTAPKTAKGAVPLPTRPAEAAVQVAASPRGRAAPADTRIAEAKPGVGPAARTAPNRLASGKGGPEKTAPVRLAQVSAPPRGAAAPSAGRAGPVVKSAAAAAPARSVVAQAGGARNAQPPAGPLGTAKASVAKLSVPPAGAQATRGKPPAVAHAAKPTESRRSRVAEAR